MPISWDKAKSESGRVCRSVDAFSKLSAYLGWFYAYLSAWATKNPIDDPGLGTNQEAGPTLEERERSAVLARAFAISTSRSRGGAFVTSD
jgi:hypothetical protein